MTNKKLIEIFRVGKHTSSSGEVVECTEADLEKLESNFSENPKVPFTIGHPKSDKEPAFGWCEKVVKKGQSLFAEMSFVSSKLADMLDEKLFNNCSIGLKKGWHLDHIALLGAAQPAVKGMEFADLDSSKTIQFNFPLNEVEPKLPWSAKNAFKAIERILGSLRDQYIADKGVEEADKIMHKYDLASIGTAAQMEFSQNTEESEVDKIEFTQKLADKDAEILTFSSKVTALEAENTSLKDLLNSKETELKQFKADARIAEFTAFADKMIEEQKLLPADKDKTLALLKSLDGASVLEFSEGDGTKQVAPVDLYMEEIKSRKPNKLLAEFASNGQTYSADEKYETLKKFAEEKQESDKSLTFSMAFKLAKQEHPELN